MYKKYLANSSCALGNRKYLINVSQKKKSGINDEQPRQILPKYYKIFSYLTSIIQEGRWIHFFSITVLPGLFKKHQGMKKN